MSVLTASLFYGLVATSIATAIYVLSVLRLPFREPFDDMADTLYAIESTDPFHQASPLRKNPTAVRTLARSF